MADERDRTDPELQSALAHYQAKRWPEAIDALSRIVNADPFNFTAASYLGAAYYQTQDFANAAQAFETAAEIKSDAPRVHYNLGLCYRATGDIPRARRSLENALKLQPVYPQAEEALAQLTAQPDDKAAPRCVNHPQVVSQAVCVSCGRPFCQKCLQLAPPERRPLGADASQEFYICSACLAAPKGPSDQLRQAEKQAVSQQKTDARGRYYGVITSAAIEGSTTQIYEPPPLRIAPPVPLWRRVALFLIGVLIVGGVLSGLYLLWYGKMPAAKPLSYSDPTGAFSITAPEGWKVTKDKRGFIPGKASVAFAPPAGVIAHESAVLTVDYDVSESLSGSLGFGPPNMERIRKEAIELGTMPGAVGLDSGTTLESERTTTIGGVGALLLEFKGSTLGEVVLEKQAWLLAPGGKVCILTFTADRKSYDKYSTAVDASMLTFSPGSGG
jgi:hypothetical protein